MKKPNDQIKTPGAEGPPDGAAAPQTQEPTEPQAPAPKPPPPLPPFFMLSHLEGGRPRAPGRGEARRVRGDGPRNRRVEAGGLRRGAQRLRLPRAAAHQAAPARSGKPAGGAQEGPATGPSPADEGGGRVASQALDRPGSPRRHTGPALLRRVRVQAVRRAARPAGAGRAVRPPLQRQAAAYADAGLGSGRHARRDGRGDAGGGGDAPPRGARRRPPGPLPPPGQVAPVTGPRLPPEPHGRRRADGPVHPPGVDSR